MQKSNEGPKRAHNWRLDQLTALAELEDISRSEKPIDRDKLRDAVRKIGRAIREGA